MREGFTQYGHFCTGGLATNHTTKRYEKTQIETIRIHAQHQTQDWKLVETLYTPQNHKKLNAMNKTILNIHKAEQRAKKACQLYLNTIFVEKILLPVLNNHDKITSLLNKLVKLSA